MKRRQPPQPTQKLALEILEVTSSSSSSSEESKEPGMPPHYYSEDELELLRLHHAISRLENGLEVISIHSSSSCGSPSSSALARALSSSSCSEEEELSLHSSDLEWGAFTGAPLVGIMPLLLTINSYVFLGVLGSSGFWGFLVLGLLGHISVRIQIWILAVTS